MADAVEFPAKQLGHRGSRTDADEQADGDGSSELTQDRSHDVRGPWDVDFLRTGVVVRAAAVQATGDGGVAGTVTLWNGTGHRLPTAEPQPVRTSESTTDMLKFDLDNENETIRNYRQRVRQCEALGEYAIAEQIRGILVNEQDHQMALATALGKDVPDVSTPEERA